MSLNGTGSISKKRRREAVCLQDISLEEIVKISFIGTRRLQIIFKEYHGCTITEYIQQRRMSQAGGSIYDKEMADYFLCAIFRYSPGRIPVLLRNSSANRLEVEYPTACAT